MEDLNIIPILADSKKPAVAWKPYLTKRFPKSELPLNGNKGVICGRTSGNLVILDLDYQQNNKRHFSKIFSKFHESYPKLIDTYITETPHGHHFWYHVKDKCPSRSPQQDTGKDTIIKHLEGKRNPTLTKVTNFPRLLKGVDILGQGGYALIPPSKINNQPYIALNEKPIKVITRPVFDKLVQFFLRAEKLKKRMRQPFFDILMGKIDIEEQAQLSGKAEHVYWKYLFLEAYHRLELNPKDIFPFLTKNQSAFDKEKTLIQLRYVNLDDAPLTNEKLYEYFPSAEKKKEEVKVKDEEPYYVTISSNLLTKYDVIAMDDSGELLIRNGNVCTADLTQFYSELADEIAFLNKSITHGTTSVKKWLRMKNTMSRDDFCYDDWLISFKNGYYDVRTETFYPQDEFKDKLFCYEIPHDYVVGENDCPKFKEMLGEWLGENSNILIDDIFEMIGYTMMMNTDMKLAFFIYGPSHGGKTQFQTILEHILGHINRADVSLQRMSHDRFGTHGLAFKLLDMVGDMSFLAINDVSAFKTMTGGDVYVPAEVKNGKQYEFYNICKIWYNGNRIPMLEHDDQAFYNRWVLIEFPNEFPMYASSTIKNIAKIINNDEGEVRGIIREALRGAKRLYRRKWFRREIIENTKHVWKYNAEPLYGFLSDSTVQDPESGIECMEFRTALNKFFYKRRLRPLTSYALTQQLERYNIYKVRRTDGDREYLYMGIRWKKFLQQKLKV